MVNDLRREWLNVQRRLERRHTNQSLHAMYLELAPLLGRLHGALTDGARADPPPEKLALAEDSFEQLRASYRRVGLDIRLASAQAMLIGLQSVVQHALETLDQLEGKTSAP